jgi:hypothetical protein
MKVADWIKVASFAVSSLMSITLAVFCIVQLSRSNDAIIRSERTVYLSLLTSTFAIWIPSPLSALAFKRRVEKVRTELNKIVPQSSVAIPISVQGHDRTNEFYE